MGQICHSVSTFKLAKKIVKQRKMTTKVLQTPIKSNTDEKKYRAIELPNGLKVLLMSDKRFCLNALDEEERVLDVSVEDESDDDEMEQDDDSAEDDEKDDEGDEDGDENVSR